MKAVFFTSQNLLKEKLVNVYIEDALPFRKKTYIAKLLNIKTFHYTA
jgi:hypothetical protein